MADTKKKNNNRDKFTSKPGDFVFVSETEMRRNLKKPKTSTKKK